MSRKELLASIPGLTAGPLPTEPGPPHIKDHGSRGQRLTRRNHDLLAQGRHPATGAPLLDAEWGYHCGDCAHAVKVSNGRRSWWKCEQHRLGMSHSDASDIRVSWPACTRFRFDAQRG